MTPREVPGDGVKPVEPLHPPMQCRTCGRPLDERQVYDKGKLTGLRHVHTSPGFMDDDGTADHPPDPVPVGTRDELHAVCDFCLGPDPAWTYPAQSFQYMVMLGGDTSTVAGSAGDWGACEACHDDIEADRWDVVFERNMVAQMKEAPPSFRPLLESMTKSMWKGFRQHRTGPPYREAAWVQADEP